MKKLLYITVNSKPESESTSKMMGRVFVDRFLAKNDNYELEELDLYNEDIPELNHKIIKARGDIVSGEEYNLLSQADKNAVDRINFLCEQFLSADTYVIAAPMWSVSFPSRLKRYIDCVIQNNKVIKITEEKVIGLLNDKEREMVYIQSSGGVYPKLLDWKLNHGVNYVHDIFKFLGIHKFEKVLIEGVDMTSVGKDKAIAKAYKDIDHVINRIARIPSMT